MKVKGAIWDFDGTLFDSMPAWSDVSEIFLRSQGFAGPFENMDRFREMGVELSAGYFIRNFGIKMPKADIVRSMYEIVKSAYFFEIMPKPHARELLWKFRTHGVRMVIATGTGAEYVGAALERCGLGECFERVFSCNFDSSIKRSPGIYRDALASIGTSRENTLVFEDACYAAGTAKKDGFHVVGVYDRSEPRQEELRRTADWYVRDYSESVDDWEL